MDPHRWRKLGLVFAVAGGRPWSVSHAQMPTPLVLGDRIRVFYSTRDARNRSATGFFDVAATDPTRVMLDHAHPVLGPGSPGTFDDCGAMASAVVEVDGEIRLYYQGWNVRTTVPFQTAIGLAISRDAGRSFERHSVGPVLDRSPADPLFCSMPTVMHHDGWRMWYASGVEWRATADGMEPRYHLHQAVSTDGIRWTPEGVALDFATPEEGGIARPAVAVGAGGWHLWYCVRHWRNYRGGAASAYRICSAQSADGIHWRRDTQPPVVDVSPAGWDSEMTAYPAVVDACGSRYMFFNGNGFGRSGIGVAVAE